MALPRTDWGKSEKRGNKNIKRHNIWRGLGGGGGGTTQKGDQGHQTVQMQCILTPTALWVNVCEIAAVQGPFGHCSPERSSSCTALPSVLVADKRA